MDIYRLTALLTEDILSEIPNAQAIVLWGGVLRNAEDAMRYGDVDVLIVCPFEQGDPGQEQDMRRRLTALATSFHRAHGLELEPAAISPDQLSCKPLPLLLLGGPYKANSVAQYLLKNESRVIYGDPGILDTMPQIELTEALTKLSTVVLSRVNAMFAELQALKESNGGTGTDDAENAEAFAAKHLSSFLVFSRSIFSLREGRITGKVEALSYVAARYPQHVRCVQGLRVLYEGKRLTTKDAASRIRADTEKVDDRLTLEDLRRYLELVNQVVSRETQAS